MELTKSIIRRYNNFVYIGGRFIPCSNAPLYCLADGIPAEDWSWIAKQESYRIPPVDFADGFAGVYNPDALYTEVERFCKHRAYFGAALTEELVCSGLNLCAQLSLSDVPAFDRARCLVVTDLNAYTEEQKNILSQAKIPILAVGEDVELPLENSIRYNGKYISAALYNSDCAPNFEPLAALDRTIRAMPSDNGDIWTEPLAYRRVSQGFFEMLAEIMNSAFSLDQAPHDVKIASYICASNKYVILSNDRHTYYLPTVKCNGNILSATALMKEHGYKVNCDSDSFTVRIPPRSVEIVKAEL